VEIAALVTRNTEPSGGDWATYCDPRPLPAPGRFSMMTEAPMRRPRRSAMMRAGISMGLPAACGTTNRTVRTGQASWARAATAPPPAAAATSMKVLRRIASSAFVARLVAAKRLGD
jgi:hypothetical protein